MKIPKSENVDKDKFDAVLRRMATMKPMSVKELSAKPNPPVLPWDIVARTYGVEARLNWTRSKN